MANMTKVIDSNTTHVHTDFSGMDRFEFLFLSGQGVVNLKHLNSFHGGNGATIYTDKFRQIIHATRY
jgi:hypothetical protein